MKRGRKKTGLLRKRISQIPFNELENEFIARKCFDLDISTARYGRRKMLPPNWMTDLNELRAKQSFTPIDQLDARRKIKED